MTLGKWLNVSEPQFPHPQQEGGALPTPIGLNEIITFLAHQECPARDFPGGAAVKGPPANAGDAGLSPGPGGFPHSAEQLSPFARAIEPAL